MAADVVFVLALVWLACGIYNIAVYLRWERAEGDGDVSLAVCFIVLLFGPLLTAVIATE